MDSGIDAGMNSMHPAMAPGRFGAIAAHGRLIGRGLRRGSIHTRTAKNGMLAKHQAQPAIVRSSNGKQQFEEQLGGLHGRSVRPKSRPLRPMTAARARYGWRD